MQYKSKLRLKPAHKPPNCSAFTTLTSITFKYSIFWRLEVHSYQDRQLDINEYGILDAIHEIIYNKTELEYCNFTVQCKG